MRDDRRRTEPSEMRRNGAGRVTLRLSSGSFTTFITLLHPLSDGEWWGRGGYGEGRDADVRGEQTQGYEAKRVRGMKGVSHSRYVHSTCLSSL